MYTSISVKNNNLLDLLYLDEASFIFLSIQSEDETLLTGINDSVSPNKIFLELKQKTALWIALLMFCYKIKRKIVVPRKNSCKL